MITPENIAASSKEVVESMLALTAKSFEGVEKLVELNLNTARASLEDGAETTKALLGAKDAQEFFALQASLFQPAADKATAYGRQVYDITSTAQAEFAKMVEAQMSGTQQKVMALVETAAKNAPAGSENAVALVKSAMTAANNALESAQKAAKQAASVAEANFQTLSAQATTAAKAAVQAARRPPVAQLSKTRHHRSTSAPPSSAHKFCSNI
ncbi:MAG: phasin family protein [Burkholderiales bacterium]|nr:phasin family protein [Burkholderiales bacterium]